MVVRLYVYATTQLIDGVEKTFYEIREASYYGISTIGITPAELAKNLQQLIQNHEACPEFQHDKEGGGSGALLVYRKPFDSVLTKEGKLAKSHSTGEMKHRSLSEEEIKEFLSALQ